MPTIYDHLGYTMVPPPSGGDDTAMISACIAANKGGRIILGPHTYKCNISLRTSPFDIRGWGDTQETPTSESGLTTLQSYDGTNFAFSIDALTTNSTPLIKRGYISGVCFYGSSGMAAGGLRLQGDGTTGVFGVVVERCQFRKCSIGTHLYSASGAAIYNNTVRDCQYFNNVTAIKNEGNSGGSPEGLTYYNAFDHCQILYTSGGYAIYDTSTEGSEYRRIVADGQFYNGGHGSRFDQCVIEKIYCGAGNPPAYYMFTDAGSETIVDITFINANEETYAWANVAYGYYSSTGAGKVITKIDQYGTYQLEYPFHTVAGGGIILRINQGDNGRVKKTGDFLTKAALSTWTFANPKDTLFNGYKWSVATAYALNDIVWPTTSNTHHYICTVAGTSDATTEPTWPTSAGTVTDSGVTWTFVS